MVIAQALGEYVAVSAIISAISRWWTTAAYYVSDVEPRTWVIGGIAFVVIAYLWNRGR